LRASDCRKVRLTDPSRLAENSFHGLNNKLFSASSPLSSLLLHRKRHLAPHDPPNRAFHVSTGSFFFFFFFLSVPPPWMESTHNVPRIGKRGGTEGGSEARLWSPLPVVRRIGPTGKNQGGCGTPFLSFSFFFPPFVAEGRPAARTPIRAGLPGEAPGQIRWRRSPPLFPFSSPFRWQKKGAAKT